MLNTDPILFTPLRQLKIVPYIDGDYIYGNSKTYLAKFPLDTALKQFTIVGWKISNKIRDNNKIIIDIVNENLEKK